MGGEKSENKERIEAPAAAAEKPSSAPETNIARAERAQDRVERAACAVKTEAGARVMECADRERSRLPAAQDEQQRNGRLLEDARRNNVPFDAGGYRGVRMSDQGKLELVAGQNEYSNSIQNVIKEEIQAGKLQPDKVYDFIYGCAKDLKSNPAKLRYFLSQVDAMLYSYYTTAEKGSSGERIDPNGVLQKMMGGSGENFQCGDISRVMVKLCSDLGVEAVSVSGVEKGVAHWATFVKMGPNDYVLYGVSRNTPGIQIKAATIEEAMKIAYRISPSFSTGGILEIFGKNGNEYFQKYALAQEALYAENADANSDRNLRIEPRMLEGTNFLTPAQKELIKKQLVNAGNSGLRVTSVSYQMISEVESGRTAANSRVVFEGFSADGGIRTVVFDINAASNENRMSVLWRTVGETNIDTVSVEVGERRNDNTLMFDESRSVGGRVEMTRRTAYSPNSYGELSGSASLEATTGHSRTLAGTKESNIVTISPDVSYRYVRTVQNNNNLRLDLWIGGGSHLLGVASDTQSNIDYNDGEKPKNNREISAAWAAQESQSVGAVISGRTGNLRYRSGLTFSLVEGSSVNNQADQRIGLQIGTRMQNETSVTYRVNDGVSFYGSAYYSRLRMPVYEKAVAGATVGVTLTNIAGIEGLDLYTDASRNEAMERLTMSTLRENLRDEGNSVKRSRLTYTADFGRAGIGFQRTERTDALRGPGNPIVSHQAMVDYSVNF